MGRRILKVLLGFGLAAGGAILFMAYQIYLIQSGALDKPPGTTHLIHPLAHWGISQVGLEALGAASTLNAALAIGGALTAMSFVGLLIVGLQDSTRARKAALLVTPPTFDECDLVSSHHFVEEGIEGRARMIRFFSILPFLATPFALLGVFAAVKHGQWLTSLIPLGATVVFVAMGVLLWRGDKNRFLKNGLERIDVMRGGLRWIRLGDPTVRTVAWSQISGSQTYDQYTQGGHPWNHYTIVTLRTGETIRLPKCCLTDYDALVDRVNQGKSGKTLASTRLEAAFLTPQVRLNR
jgi:hypothetical protein